MYLEKDMGLNGIRIDEFFLDEENDNVRNIRTDEENDKFIFSKEEFDDFK